MRRKKTGILLFLLAACIGVFAPVKLAAQNPDGAYMIPTKVYVGDRASLVLPLPGFSGARGTELSPEQIPFSPDIDIHRVALERRPGGNRLTIEFSAFAPGMLELPPIDVAGEIFSGLEIEISSILVPGESEKVLSGAAGPLAVPGTSLLVYGTLSAAVAALLLALWALIWGRRQMKTWLAAWKRWRLLVSMWKIEKRLRKALAKGAAYREILDTLSVEFRSFLSYFSGMNCRSMTAFEFGSAAFFEEYSNLPDSRFLGDFFDRCDNMRFCGNAIGSDETYMLLNDTRSFLTALGKAKRSAV